MTPSSLMRKDGFAATQEVARGVYVMQDAYNQVGDYFSLAGPFAFNGKLGIGCGASAPAATSVAARAVSLDPLL